MSSESLPAHKVILASNSSIRKKILEEAGITFEVIASEVDEEELKKSLSSNNFKDYCLALAKAKACLLYTSPSPRDRTRSRMPSSA